MALFIVRVELHGAAHNDRVYTDLHEYMRDEGFGRTIRSDEGVLYQMLPAEYIFEQENDFEVVHAKAQLAANKTGYENAVFVTQGIRACWRGLEPSRANRFRRKV